MHGAIDASGERAEGHGADGGCGGSVGDAHVRFAELQLQSVERRVVVSGVDDADKACVPVLAVYVECKGGAMGWGAAEVDILEFLRRED